MRLRRHEAYLDWMLIAWKTLYFLCACVCNSIFAQGHVEYMAHRANRILFLASDASLLSPVLGEPLPTLPDNADLQTVVEILAATDCESTVLPPAAIISAVSLRSVASPSKCSSSPARLQSSLSRLLTKRLTAFSPREHTLEMISAEFAQTGEENEAPQSPKPLDHNRPSTAHSKTTEDDDSTGAGLKTFGMTLPLDESQWADTVSPKTKCPACSFLESFAALVAMGDIQSSHSCDEERGIILRQRLVLPCLRH